MTAQRRSESLQRVPVSVTAIGGDQLTRTYARNLSDFSKASPNFTIEGVGSISRSSAVVFSRGIGFSSIDVVEPPIAISIDGQFYAVNVGTLLNTYDVNQIEILKGPQGTLFGRNTTGGVIQITTNNPTDTFSVSGLVRAGSYGRFDTNLTVNVPLSDTLALRVSGNTQYSKGPFTNNYVDPATGGRPANRHTGGDNNQAIRAKLRWAPNDNLTVLLTGFYTHQAQDAPVGTSANGPTDRLFTRGVANANSPVDGRPGIGYPGGPTDPYVVHRDTNGADNLKQKSGILNVNYRTGAGFDITSLTSYLKYNSKQIVDFDATDVNFFTTLRYDDRSQFSQELRFASSDTASRFQWQGGLFYFTTKFLNRQQNILGPTVFAQTAATSPVVNQFLAARIFEESYAAFAQGDFHLTDQLVLTAGGRYTHERKNATDYPSLTNLSQPFVGVALSNSAKWKDFTYHLAARYQFTPDFMAYVSYSTGQKAGGFLATATTQSQMTPFEPEKARAWEGGIRTQFLDRRVTFNMTGFWNNYSNLQINAFRPVVGGSGQQSFVANAAFERARGVEIEATATPLPGLRLGASVGYLDARYTSFIAALSYNFPGHVCNGLTGGAGSPPIEQNHADPSSPCFLLPPRVPEWTVGLDAAYDIDLGGSGKLTPHVAYSFEDKHYTNTTNAPQGFQPAFSLFNADLSYTSPDSRWRVSVFGKNLGNTRHLVSTNPIAGLFTVNYYSEPRTYGVELGVKF